MLGIMTMLLTSIGYLYGHKLLVPGEVAGVVIGLWQLLVALIVLSIAGGVGERLLGTSELDGLVRFALAAALGAIVLSITTLLVGATVGTSLTALGAEVLVLGALVVRSIPGWWRNLAQLPRSIAGGYDKFIASSVMLVLFVALGYALAPPTEFDALVYHLSIPLSYLQHGRIVYLPDTMFWGMPQLAEVLYLPLMRLAGVEAAAIFVLVAGATALVGLFGYVKGLFGNAAAWTAVAALVIGENLAHSLSTAYVDWVCILFGISALAAISYWLPTQQRKMLILAGVFCGGALSTKYTAGILLIGVILAVAMLPRYPTRQARLSAIVIVGLAAAAVTLPWWIKNWLAVGNPFYPFFFPSGAMDQHRLDFYQKVPVWRDWRAVILLPWQATFLGIDGKEGFSTSIGALLVGLSPLAWIGWKQRTDEQKRAILLAAVVTIAGLFMWAAASRISGLLLQTRLYLAFFPAWAVLAGAGFEAIGKLSSTTIRFGRLLKVLVVSMCGMTLFYLIGDFVHSNPALYVFRLEDEKTFLYRNMGAYAAAMDAVDSLPASAHVLMLWETRGYYCEPRCDPDEIIDRWFDDGHLNGTSQAVIQEWHQQGYTDLLIFNLGMEYVRTHDYPQEQKMHWSLLDSTLRSLTVEEQVADGAYTLYHLP